LREPTGPPSGCERQSCFLAGQPSGLPISERGFPPDKGKWNKPARGLFSSLKRTADASRCEGSGHRRDDGYDDDRRRIARDPELGYIFAKGSDTRRNTMRKLLILTLFLPVVLPGCQTWGPTWSEITGDRYVGGILYRRPAIIEHIDDQGAFPSNPIKVEPGDRRLIIGAPVPRWPGGSDLKVMMLDVEPCKRYYINAQFENNVSLDWSPVIDYVDTIAGCKVEAKK
jgi:hypothetical protein